MAYIFVYGTLRHGGGLNFKIDNARHVGSFKTKPIYTLYDVGHPCLAKGGTTSVVGDVYEIEDLAQIIHVHNMETRAGYTLEKVELQGFRKKVSAYMQVPEKDWPTRIVRSGDWVSYLRGKNGANKAAYA